MRLAPVLVVAGCSFAPGAAPAPRDGRIGDGPADSRAIGTTDARAIDAPPDAPQVCNDAVCAAAGGSCINDSTCEIVVSTTGNVACPTGMDCLIVCNGTGSCNGMVSCGYATACTIDCVQNGTCDAVFDCTHVACTLYCRGNNTCVNSNINVTGSSCDIECCGNNACVGAFAHPIVCTNNGDMCP